MQTTSFPSANIDPGQEVVELMIPANKVGLIIGKNGRHCVATMCCAY